MSFLLYLLGFVVLISGLACVATMLGVAQAYVSGGALVLLAIAVVSSIANVRSSGEEAA